MINVAICENNAMQIKYVVDVIKKYSIKENMDFMIDKFISGEELLNSNHSKYNVIFLEIKMNGISGIDTAKKIREINEEVKIIFLTASKELWAEAFKVKLASIACNAVSPAFFAVIPSVKDTAK